MARERKSVLSGKQGAYSTRNALDWESQLCRIRSYESRTGHTLCIHGVYGGWEIPVCKNILWVKPLVAAFANDNHLRFETAESMVQSVFTHVGSIASGNFWDEESTFAPIKKQTDGKNNREQVNKGSDSKSAKKQTMEQGRSKTCDDIMKTKTELTLVIPLDIWMGGDNGSHHTGLRLVGFIVGFGACRRHFLLETLLWNRVLARGE